MDQEVSVPGDGSRLLTELCAERDALLLRLGGRDGKEGGCGEGRDSIDVPCHSLRLLEDGR